MNSFVYRREKLKAGLELQEAAQGDDSSAGRSDQAQAAAVINRAESRLADITACLVGARARVEHFKAILASFPIDKLRAEQGRLRARERAR